MLSRLAPLLAVVLLPLAAWAKNDWSQACLSGECDWDIPSGSGSSGTVRVAGSSTGISDLTEAAGWVILGCNSTAADQDVRVACYDSDMGCDHLYLNGAENTIVRLPDECASMPFALVLSVWDHEDQSIPASKRSLLTRRNGTDPIVKGMSLSTQFADANSTQHGDVMFFVQGSSVESVASDFVVNPSRTDNSSVADWVAQTSTRLSEVHANVTASEKTTSTAAASVCRDRRSLAKRSPLKVNVATHDFGFSFPETTLLDVSLSCAQSGDIPGFSADVDLGVGGSVNGTLKFGIAMALNIFDLKNFQLGITVGLDSVMTGNMGLTAGASGTFSVKQTLYTVGLPGLSIPAIISIGPTFSLIGGATASLDTALDMDVDLAYTISGAQFVYPPMKVDGSSTKTSLLGGIFTPGSNTLKLSASPNITASGTLSGHLIPQLAFGVSALNGQASATVNFNVDASAGLALNGTASASGTLSTESDASGAGAAAGCVDVYTGLGVNVGASASLFGVFNPNVATSLFDGQWDLFSTCGSTAGAKRMVPVRRGLGGRRAVEGRDAVSDALASIDWSGLLSGIADGIFDGLVCPASAASALATITNSSSSTSSS
ncbi:uncharacterized protein BXZ73DRAFT_104666 [Epithele typhae]|uniref:uncharacterized protein n=1 Tax=Epithele typhae TaxID=378194 RepID=UPI002007D4D2|nr:uncharacterized protein BXZ73DRAFT_104666 [Epithele typhae]KAH9920540.1 hypothetical protein BXZ73DRAFT_104666 [Epithele typhae]